MKRTRWFLVPASLLWAASYASAGEPMSSPKENSRYFSLALRREKQVITCDFLRASCGSPGGDHGHSGPGADCLFRATLMDGSVIEFLFEFSGIVDFHNPSATPWAPGEDGTRDMGFEADQDLRKIQVLDATTKVVKYEKIFSDPGVKPTISASLGAQNEFRFSSTKKVDYQSILFSVDQGTGWFPPNYRNSTLKVVDAQGTWPVLLKEPDKPQRKVWVDVLLLFGGTTVHKQYEYDQDKGLTDVTGQGLWICPRPVRHNPAPYW